MGRVTAENEGEQEDRIGQSRTSAACLQEGGGSDAVGLGGEKAALSAQVSEDDGSRIHGSRGISI